ncbi:Transthyretin-like family protein [Trichuris suis]|nr:Transthyretin-like family protein [Trichuris suis]
MSQLLLSRPEMSVIISNRKLRDNCSVRWAVSMHNTEFFPDLIKDDTLAKQETIEDGSFHLDGTDDEIGTIEPELKVCKRRWIIKIPDRYKYSPSANERVFVVGTVNLEIHLKEDKKCLPV